MTEGRLTVIHRRREFVAGVSWVLYIKGSRKVLLCIIS